VSGEDAAFHDLSAGLFTLIIRDPVSPNPITEIQVAWRRLRAKVPERHFDSRAFQGFRRAAHSA
jgi:hypothetical protein